MAKTSGHSADLDDSFNESHREDENNDNQSLVLWGPVTWVTVVTDNYGAGVPHPRVNKTHLKVVQDSKGHRRTELLGIHLSPKSEFFRQLCVSRE